MGGGGVGDRGTVERQLDSTDSHGFRVDVDITAVDETRQNMTLGYVGVFSHDLAASRDHVNTPIAVLLQSTPAHRIGT